MSEIAEAMACQAGTLAYVTGTAFTHDAVEEFAAEIARLSPGDLELVYPLASGSEAVEAGLKLARQYWVECGRPEKHKILAFAPSYHGNTLLALSASSREQLPGVLSRVAGSNRQGAGPVSVPLCLSRTAALVSGLHR